jgi:hypothetical protein
MNLLALRQVVRDLGFDGTTDPVVNRRLNAAYRDLAGHKRWPWLERNDTTLTTTSGSSEVALSDIADLMWVDAVRIYSGSEPSSLEYQDPQDFQDDNFPYGAARGAPLRWTEQFTQLRLAPTPQAEYTLSIDYLTTPPELVDDEDEPLFDSTYHDILAWGAAVSDQVRPHWGSSYRTVR